jgi:hypothetical protein
LVRVVEDVGDQVDRLGGDAGSQAGKALDAELDSPSLDERRRGVLRAPDDLRVRSVDHELHVRGFPSRDVRGIACRDDERRAGSAGTQCPLDLVVAVRVADEVEEARCLQPPSQIARLGAPVVIVDERGCVSDVSVDGVAEEEQEDDGHHAHHREREPIATELQELLPADEALPELHAPALTMATNASSTFARVSRALRNAMPRPSSAARANATGSWSSRTAMRKRCP